MSGRDDSGSTPPGAGPTWSDVDVVDLDTKIVTLLERVGQALRVRQGEVARDEGLTPLQLKLVLYLGARPSGRRTVSQASDEFDLTLPTVSDAVNTLVTKKIVARRASLKDRRVAHLHLTTSGQALVGRLGTWREVFEAAATQAPRSTRETVFLFLARFVESLHNDGVLNVARMCLTCQHLEERSGAPGEAPYYCGLLGQEKGPAGLRLDCPTHEKKHAGMTI